MNSLVKSLVLVCLVGLPGLASGGDCGPELGEGSKVEVHLNTETSYRVRIIPVGRATAGVPRFQFGFGGTQLSAAVTYSGTTAYITVQNDKNSQVLLSFPLDQADDQILAGRFDIAGGDHGLLTLETRDQVYVLEVHHSRTK